MSFTLATCIQGTYFHLPCGCETCKCPLTKIIPSEHNKKRSFEVQLDTFTCGPIAVYNALRYVNRDPGRALRRSIIVSCKTKEVHEDGFRGTKPQEMHKTLVSIFKDNIIHYVGAKQCKRALQHKGNNAFIVLYSGYERGIQFFHYIFLHREGDNLYTQNDGCQQEVMLTTFQALQNYTAYDGKEPIIYPQIWKIK